MYYSLINEIQIQKKAPINVYGEQIYLDKDNNWKIMCLMVGSRILLYQRRRIPTI